MSSTDRAATSPRRDPSRASTVRIATSRRPVPLRRSQPCNIRATSSTATARTTPRYANPKRVWRWGCVAGRRRHPQTRHLIDAAAGRPVSPNLAQRMITISFEQLQAIPGVVAMSHGIVRLAATRAILRSGVVDYLVIDDELAHALLVDSPMLVETTGSPRSVDPDMR